MARPKPRDSRTRQLWQRERQERQGQPAPRPPPTSAAGRDASLRRQIRAGTIHPRRPPAPCTLDPVQAAAGSDEWEVVLAQYLWAWSADTWEVWDAYVRREHPEAMFYGSPRDTLYSAVERFHLIHQGHIDFRAPVEARTATRPTPGSAQAVYWWLARGIDPSVRDVLRRVVEHARQRRLRHGADPDAKSRQEFLVDAFAGDPPGYDALVPFRYRGAFDRSPEGTIVIVPPPEPEPLNPVVQLVRVARTLEGIAQVPMPLLPPLPPEEP